MYSSRNNTLSYKLNYAGYKKILLFCMTITFLVTSCSSERYLKRGDAYTAIGEYFLAADAYKTAYSKTSTKERTLRGHIASKLAESYRHIGQTAKAAAAYRNTIRYKAATNSDSLQLARVLLQLGDYKQAQNLFQELPEIKEYNLLIKNGLTSSIKAPENKKKGSKYTVKKMDVFQSRRAEYCPAFADENGEILYFTSTRNEATGNDLSGITGMKAGDIFMTRKDDKGKWSRPQPVQGELNSMFDEGACCFSPDGRTMYLTICETHNTLPRRARIATSLRSDATWSKPQFITLTTDTLSSVAHPAVSPDGQWLYFVSDMPGGEGGLDIWRVRITTHGFGGVENLGKPINTPGNEMFPTFRPNGDFYFSSDGHVGMGGLDIYMAQYDEQLAKWQITHPGYPLNSQGDDFGMTFESSHNRGFFSSNRNDHSGRDHLYSFEHEELTKTIRGWVYEKDGYELPQAQVYLVGNDGTNRRMALKSDGSFTYQATPGVSYVMLATCKGYLNHKETITIDTVSVSQLHDIQFPLASITVPVLIDNIEYDFDKATLRPESMTALDNLVTILNDNPNVTIELSASCDYRGDEKYNQQLSQQRAENVVKYLVAKGIAKERLTAVGYGESKPKTVSRKLAEKYTFLHEGDILTEVFIKQQNGQEQEICNQLNRRTEFKVLRTTFQMYPAENKKP